MPVSTRAMTPYDEAAVACAVAGTTDAAVATTTQRAARARFTSCRTKIPCGRNRARGPPRVREVERRIVDPAALEQHDVADVVLVEPPRRPVALLRKLVHRPENVVGREVDERVVRQLARIPARHDLGVAALGHVVEQPAHVL